MNFSALHPVPSIPKAVMSFDPEAGDCTCVNPANLYIPPVDMSRRRHAALLAAMKVNDVSVDAVAA